VKRCKMIFGSQITLSHRRQFMGIYLSICIQWCALHGFSAKQQYYNSQGQDSARDKGQCINNWMFDEQIQVESLLAHLYVSMTWRGEGKRPD